MLRWGSESSKYWLGVLKDLKNRRVKDVMVICADGLTGIKEAIAAAFPQAEYQRCIVHQVRNTLEYVSYKDMKSFASDDRKVIYTTNAIESLNSTYKKPNRQRTGGIPK